MSLIKPNWSTLIRIVLILVAIVVINRVVNKFFEIKPSSLRYNSLTREFYLIVNKKNNQQNEFTQTALFYDDIYDVDEQTEHVIKLKSAHFPFSKIPLQNWYNYCEYVKSVGLNSIQIDIVWNVHEPYKKKYDFTTGSNDLEEFIKLVKHFGLYLIVRIDPYVHCSNYDLGGLPAWLLAVENKTNSQTHILNLKNAVFKQLLVDYYSNLVPILVKYQLGENGGPIIGVLTQYYDQTVDHLSATSIHSFYNENYIKFLKNFLYSNAFYEVLLTSENVCQFDKHLDKHEYKRYCDSSLNIYSPVYLNVKPSISIPTCTDDRSKYWNVHWIKKNNPPDNLPKTSKDLLKFKFNLRALVQTNKSFNMENFFCHLNYGFSSGAHHDPRSKGSLLPINPTAINSYYSCQIDENSQTTPKYDITLDILSRSINNIDSNSTIKESDFSEIKNNPAPVRQADMVLSESSQIKLTHVLPFEKLISFLSSPVPLKKNNEHLFMEYINLNYNLQSNNYGYILYRLKLDLTAGSYIILKTDFIRDYAILVCDLRNVLITIDHQYEIDETISIPLNADCNQLDVLVENLGRLSDLDDVANIYSQRKGLLTNDAIGFIRANNKNVMEIDTVNWKIHFIDFMQTFINRFTYNSEYVEYKPPIDKNRLANLPLMVHGKFNVNRINNELTKSKGIYLLLSNFNKGVVVLNGYNLGRYWNVGPLLTMFVPNFLLNEGINELNVFDIHGLTKEPIVYVTKNHVLL